MPLRLRVLARMTCDRCRAKAQWESLYTAEFILYAHPAIFPDYLLNPPKESGWKRHEAEIYCPNCEAPYVPLKPGSLPLKGGV